MIFILSATKVRETILQLLPLTELEPGLSLVHVTTWYRSQAWMSNK